MPTRSTTNFDSGDIVLVRVAFTDLSGAKVRPAIVLSDPALTRKFGDVVVMPLTSRKSSDKRLALAGWKQAGLLGPAFLKPLLVSIASADIVRRLGQLMKSDDANVQHAVRLVLAARWLA